MKFWFAVIKRLKLRLFDTSKVQNFKGMFAMCTELEYLDISKFNTSMGMMFYGLEKLESLDVSHFITDQVSDMYLMFASYKRITSLDISKFKTESCTDTSEMFKL